MRLSPDFVSSFREIKASDLRERGRNYRKKDHPWRVHFSDKCGWLAGVVEDLDRFFKIEEGLEVSVAFRAYEFRYDNRVCTVEIEFVRGQASRSLFAKIDGASLCFMKDQALQSRLNVHVENNKLVTSCIEKFATEFFRPGLH